MKTFTSLLLSICTMGIFTQCASSQFVDNPPFELDRATEHRIMKGDTVEKGRLLKIVLDKVNTDDIVFDKVYFGNRALDVSPTIDGNTVILEAKYTAAGEIRDLVLHKDPKKEVGNRPPAPVEKMPFELKKGEVVIAYTDKGKTKYFRIEQVQNGDSVIYP